MGISSGFVATRHRFSVSLEDICKKRLQRYKVKGSEKPLNVPTQNKIKNCKLSPLKCVLAIIVCGTFERLLYSPEVIISIDNFSNSGGRSNFVNWWTLHKSDPRYISDLDINWDDIKKVIAKLSEYKEIGLLNFNETETNHLKDLIPDATLTVLPLDYAAKNVTWKSLYPEWIDEEEENEVPVCPTLPKIKAPTTKLNLIAVKLPCRNGKNWSRDVARLHLQLAAAGLAAAGLAASGLAASAKAYNPIHLLFVTNCFPIPNLFNCKEIVARESDVWLYKPNLNVLGDRLQLPIGSCKLALPLQPKEQVYSGNVQREAYATILHSANAYVCGAIAAAQSIRMASSTRDLVILVDETISAYHRSGLEAAGWKVKRIQRIRNPKAQKDAYNEWNYSKFRLWQLTDYDKVVFIDADMLILKNTDVLFGMPELSATGNDATLFNSGVMVIEPSNCTFQLLMDHINELESYNGGDQGYLNEIFTWWHRIPKHMNFLKHFWIGDDEKMKQKKTRLFGADPPVLSVIHYLGLKPWLCFRDYDCNWNVEALRDHASDVAHGTWWKVHDAMPEKLQEFCLLRSKQKAQLEWDRRQAEKANYTDEHWRIKVKDSRLMKCIDKFCSWEEMLLHWGERK